MVKGSIKGGSYEREICKKLSLFISEGLTDSIFWRSSGSGARATVQLKNDIANPDQAGDISIISSYFRKGLEDSTISHVLKMAHKFSSLFTIELKHYKKIQLKSLMFLTPKKASILAFWEEAVIEARGANKNPILIIRRNNWPDIMVLSPEYSESKKLIEMLKRAKLVIAEFPMIGKEGVVLVEFEDFCDFIDPSVFLKL